MSDDFKISSIKLQQKLVEHFDLGELNTLCFKLGLDFNGLPGHSKAEKCTELVKRMKRHEQTLELVSACLKERPTISLLDLSESNLPEKISMTPSPPAGPDEKRDSAHITSETDLSEQISMPPPRIPILGEKNDSTHIAQNGFSQNWWCFVAVVSLSVLALIWFLSSNPGIIDSLTGRHPPVSLFSLGYMIENNDPHVIDLQKTINPEIQFGDDGSLQIFDLWISSPRKAPDYVIQVEIYEDPNLINLIGVAPGPLGLPEGNTKLGDMRIEKYFLEGKSHTWAIPPTLTNLYVVLIAYHGDDRDIVSVTNIYLDPNT
ncbi:MAG: hypothetical protein GY803_17225 [Chloroflexi bacterium]|nr:hypothetical protein [Chloroflexota bacterium]